MANVCKQIFQPQRNQYYILHTTYLKQFCFVLNSQHVVEPWNKNVISFRGDSLTICHPSMKVAWDPWNHFILQLDNEFCQTTRQQSKSYNAKYPVEQIRMDIQTHTSKVC